MTTETRIGPRPDGCVDVPCRFVTRLDTRKFAAAIKRANVESEGFGKVGGKFLTPSIRRPRLWNKNRRRSDAR